MLSQRDPGKGSYWYVDLNEELSTPRHRNRKKGEDTEIRLRGCSVSSNFSEEDQTSSHDPTEWTSMQGHQVPQEPLHVVSKLAQTRPRSLSDFTFFGRPEEGKLAPSGYEAEDQSSHRQVEFPNIREPQPALSYHHHAHPMAYRDNEIHSFNHILKQVLQVSNVDTTNGSYKSTGLGVMF